MSITPAGTPAVGLPSAADAVDAEASPTVRLSRYLSDVGAGLDAAQAGMHDASSWYTGGENSWARKQVESAITRTEEGFGLAQRALIDGFGVSGLSDAQTTALRTTSQHMLASLDALSFVRLVRRVLATWIDHLRLVLRCDEHRARARRNLRYTTRDVRRPRRDLAGR